MVDVITLLSHNPCPATKWKTWREAKMYFGNRPTNQCWVTYPDDKDVIKICSTYLHADGTTRVSGSASMLAKARLSKLHHFLARSTF